MKFIINFNKYMKSVLFLALAVALVTASPIVAAHNYSFSDWFTTNFNIFVLYVLLSYHALVGYFAALFGTPAYFNNNAWDLISNGWQLPAYKAQGFIDTLDKSY